MYPDSSQRPPQPHLKRVLLVVVAVQATLEVAAWMEKETELEVGAPTVVF